MESKLATIHQVSTVQLKFFPRTFENGTSWRGDITSSATSKKDLVQIYKESLKVMWNSNVTVGDLNLLVTNPKTGQEAGGADLGFNGVADYDSLEKLFGPRRANQPGHKSTA